MRSVEAFSRSCYLYCTLTVIAIALLVSIDSTVEDVYISPGTNIVLYTIYYHQSCKSVPRIVHEAIKASRLPAMQPNARYKSRRPPFPSAINSITPGPYPGPSATSRYRFAGYASILAWIHFHCRSLQLRTLPLIWSSCLLVDSLSPSLQQVAYPNYPNPTPAELGHLHVCANILFPVPRMNISSFVLMTPVSTYSNILCYRRSARKVSLAKTDEIRLIILSGTQTIWRRVSGKKL